MMEKNQSRRPRSSERTLRLPILTWLALLAHCLMGCASPIGVSAVEPASSVEPASAAEPASVASSAGPILAGPYEISLSATEVPDGGVVLLQAKALDCAHAPRLLASFQDHEFHFFPDGDGRAAALVGVPYDLKSGQYSIRVLVGEGENEKKFEIAIRVKEGGYIVEVLKVPPRITHPTAADGRRIAREQKEIAALYQHFDPTKMWTGPFHFPVNSVITSRYGNKRIFNGKTESFHRGLDLRAPIGTPITAPAEGEVVLAKNLFFTGNTVILSHGYGLFTIYAHMSALKVKRGMKVKAGGLLGLSGMTGRAAGPHLHWGVTVSRVTVDPLEMMKVVK